MTSDRIETLDAALKAVYDKLRTNLKKIAGHKNVNSNIYFHYTKNYKNLLSILENQELYCSDFTCLNDPSELRYGHDFFLKILKKHAEGANDVAKVFWELFLNLFEKYVFHEDAGLANGKKFLYSSVNSEAGHYKHCFASMCKNGDSLPLWRYYGNEAAGFSVGFEIIEEDPIEPPELPLLSFDKVHYIDENNTETAEFHYYNEFSKEMIKKLMNLFWKISKTRVLYR